MYYTVFILHLVPFHVNAKTWILETENDSAERGISNISGQDFSLRSPQQEVKAKSRKSVVDNRSVQCPPPWKSLTYGCYHFAESPMTWKEAKQYCTNLGAKMVVVENEKERIEITKMASKPISKRVRFWLDVTKTNKSWKTHDSRKVPKFTPWGPSHYEGNCIRSGPQTKWYKSDCSLKSLPGGYTLNPLCKTAKPETIIRDETERVDKYELVRGEMSIKKNNLITKLQFIGKEYKISFDLFVSKFQVSGYYRSVIHFTTGGNYGQYGDRTPGIWIINKKLYIVSPVNGNHNYEYTSPSVLKEGKWTNVEISQTLVGDVYMYEIRINKKIVLNVENTKAGVFYNVKAFVGDPWHTPVDGKIRYLSAETGAQCLPKWKSLSYGCYHFVESPMTWKDAKHYCTNLGANMVVVENDKERNEITKMASEPISRLSRFWLDVTKDKNSWKTHDSSKVPNFTPWGPNYKLHKGNCVRSGPKTNWYPSDCSLKSKWGYTYNPMCKMTHHF